MTLGRIQDPKGAKTIVVSYKTTPGATTTISRQHFKEICSAEPKTGGLTIEKDTTQDRN